MNSCSVRSLPMFASPRSSHAEAWVGVIPWRIRNRSVCVHVSSVWLERGALSYLSNCMTTFTSAESGTAAISSKSSIRSAWSELSPFMNIRMVHAAVSLRRQSEITPGAFDGGAGPPQDAMSASATAAVPALATRVPLAAITISRRQEPGGRTTAAAFRSLKIFAGTAVEGNRSLVDGRWIPDQLVIRSEVGNLLLHGSGLDRRQIRDQDSRLRRRLRNFHLDRLRRLIAAEWIKPERHDARWDVDQRPNIVLGQLAPRIGSGSELPRNEILRRNGILEIAMFDGPRQELKRASDERLTWVVPIRPKRRPRMNSRDVHDPIEVVPVFRVAAGRTVRRTTVDAEWPSFRLFLAENEARDAVPQTPVRVLVVACLGLAFDNVRPVDSKGWDVPVEPDCRVLLGVDEGTIEALLVLPFDVRA